MGVRWDARDGVYEQNYSYDVVWPAATKILEDRWTVEMAIPIGAMLFNRGENQTWGLNFRRRARNANISGNWNYHVEAGVPRRNNGPKATADFGLLTGLDLSNVNVSRRPKVETFTSMTTTQREGDLDNKFATGLDVELRLGNKWVATFTANPDFGQIEADSDDIELRDVERFVPERRPFFNEGSELFQTPLNIYNSRRILDIRGGAKVTGTGKNWTMGLLGLDGESTRSGDAQFTVARYTQNVSRKTQLGGVFINAGRQDGYNLVTGLDSRVELTQSLSWTSQYLRMVDRGERATDGADSISGMNGHAWTTGLQGGAKPLYWELDFTDISEHFDPDLGFIRRQDVIGPKLEVELDWDQIGGPVEAYGGFLQIRHFQNHDGETVLRDVDIFADIELNNDHDFGVFRRTDFRRPFNNHETGFTWEYRRHERLKAWETSVSWGEFQDVPFKGLSIEKPFGIGKRHTAEVELTYRRESPGEAGGEDEDDEDVWLVRFVNEYTFQWDGRVRFILEETSEERHNRTILFAYEDIAKWDLYFLLSDIQSRGETTRGAFVKFVRRF